MCFKAVKNSPDTIKHRKQTQLLFLNVWSVLNKIAVLPFYPADGKFVSFKNLVCLLFSFFSCSVLKSEHRNHCTCSPKFSAIKHRRTNSRQGIYPDRLLIQLFSRLRYSDRLVQSLFSRRLHEPKKWQNFLKLQSFSVYFGGADPGVLQVVPHVSALTLELLSNVKEHYSTTVNVWRPTTFKQTPHPSCLTWLYTQPGINNNK